VESSVSIPARFNGPHESGNGGYCSGVVANAMAAEQAVVSLRSPVPLDTELAVAREDDGGVRLLDGETLVAEGLPGEPVDLEIPAPVGVDEARAAMEGYRGLDTGPFSHCFVCGRAREDSYAVFAGKVAGRDVVASTWTPPAGAAGGDGNVLPEHIWAVLDCPTYFATYVDSDLQLSFLARFAVRIDAPVPAGREHVAIAWPIAVDGRKRRAGAALMSADGDTLAVADALLIEPRT
jgi:hypothetical protein